MPLYCAQHQGILGYTHPFAWMQTTSVSFPKELSSCFCMVLEAGLLGPNMVLEGDLLAVPACWQSGLLAPRDLPLAREAHKMVLAAM